MKTIITGIALLVALATSSCSKNADTSEVQGEGQVTFSLDATGDVTSTGDQSTRATRQLPVKMIPSASNFAVKLATADASMEISYEKLSAYDQPLLSSGDYTVSFTHGSPTAEGPDAAYFEGAGTFKVIARKTISVPFTASLANSALSLATTEWFNKYYTSATLTLRTDTDKGYKETFTINLANGKVPTGDVPVFIRPNAKIFLSGKAKKTNGVDVTFPETEIGAVKARTWHTVIVDMSSASHLSIQIHLDDTMTEIREDVELNPEA